MKFILGRPVTLTMIVALIVALGILSFSSIRRQINPDGFEPRFLYVEVYNFNLSPEETDKTISEPLSGMMRTLKDIKRIRSRSYESRVSLNINFQPSANMRAAYLELQSVLDRAREFLPADAKTFIWRWNPDTAPIIWAGFQPPKSLSPADAKEAFESRIKPVIQRVEGVANVDVYGFREKTAMIRLNEDLLSQYNIPPSRVLGAIRQSDKTASLGEAGATPVVFVHRIMALDQLASIEVRPGIQLRHLGKVAFEEAQKDRIIRIDGQEFYWLSVSKQDGANVLEVSRRVIEKMQQIEDQTALGQEVFRFQVMWNEGEEVEAAITTISQTAMFAGVIAFFVVLVFLRHLPMTLLVSTAIPLSIMVTVIWLYFTDQTLNILSMMGIMLACGMVVDNGIVVAEAIFVRLRGSVTKRQAILEGVKDVGLPVLMGTTTSIAVFLPLIMMSGDSNFSFFMAKLGIPVCVALVTSLGVALVIVPYLINNLSIRPSLRSESVVWQRMLDAYGFLLSFALRHRLEVLACAFVLGALTLWASDKFMPEDRFENNSRLRFRVEFDEGLAFHQRAEYLDSIESIMQSHRERFDIKRVRTNLRRHSCCARVRISRNVDQVLTNLEVRRELRQILPVWAGVSYDLREVSDDERALTKRYKVIQIRGPKIQPLNDLATTVKASIEAIEGVAEVKVETDDQGGRNVEIIPSTNRAPRPETSAQNIATEVQARLAVDRPFKLDERYPVEVRSSRQIKNLEQIRDIELTGGVPLRHLAGVNFAPKNLEPHRINGALTQELSVFFDESLTEDDRDVTRAQLDNLLKNLSLPAGYVLAKDVFDSKNRDDRDMYFALIMAVLLVFLIMGVLFESSSLPFVILFTIPLAFMGSTWMSIIMGTAPGIMGKLGMVILVGIVVNNGIVLVDLINKRIVEFSTTRQDAILSACKRRLRPVLMTAATTVFGLFPMAFGSSNLLGIPFSPLGHAIIGGLVFSTGITLFLIPVILTLTLDAKLVLAQIIGRSIPSGDRHLARLWSWSRRLNATQR